MSANIEKLNCEQFHKYLLSNGYCKSIAVAFLNHKICGRTFLELTDADLKHILPLVGDRVHMRKLLLDCKISSWRDGVSKADARVKLEATPDPPETSKRKQMLRQMSWSFLEEVSAKLTVVQKERQDMEKAMLQGED